ncbi:type II secretion system protein [Sulfurovum mangrovi]|uniref:type II secretion system protein n=1 Tax=Sulfurovum mangrovi TaxID=2893889 RepID=UPI001E42B287|nr:type II secretion system protein [Sulfurovum mangrovi]UFH58996.1 type II secretion system GspH family protein [Sulfurovum mangrovi]
MQIMHKKAFTLVELIFIIVVLGILSIVAIPRYLTQRDDATAAVCTQEVQQLISEISQKYLTVNYHTFDVMPIDEITNIRTGAVSGNGISSVSGTLVKNGIVYICDGENLVELKGGVVGTEYNLTVRDLDPSNAPAAVTAAEIIRNLNGIETAGGTNSYKL